MTRGSAAAYVERGLAIFAILWQLAWSLTDVAPRVISTGSAALLALLAVTTLTWLALVATIWGPEPWRRARPAAILLDIAFLGLAAAIYSFVVPEPDTWPLGTIAAVRACVVASLLLRVVPGGIVAGCIALSTGVIAVLGPAGIGPVDALIETLYAVALAAGAAVLADGMRRSGRRLDRAHRALADEEAERRARQEVDRATADHERHLHDQVLNTLAAIGRGGLADVAATRSRCADAARALQSLVSTAGEQAPDPWSQVYAELSALPADWNVEAVDLRAILHDCPAELAGAVGAAAAEAVRNAGRHSGGSRVRVAVRREGSAWWLTIDDDGTGIAPGTRPGLGMTRSMQDPVVSWGGTVTWSMSPLGGARVEIAWQPRCEDGSSAAVRLVESDTMQVLPQVGPPFLLTFLGYGLIVVVAGWSTYEQPLWALGWFAVAAAIAPFIGGVPAWAARLGLTGGPTWSPRVLLGIGLALLSTPLILRMEIAAVGGADPPIWVTWSSEVALSLLFVVILLGPWWTVIPALAMWVYAQGGGLLELLQPGTFMLLIAALFAASMRRRARDYALAREAVIAERARSEADGIDRARREARFAPLVASAGALLTTLSTDSVDLDSPDTRSACLREERFARSLVRIDRAGGPMEALVVDVVEWGHARGRVIDAEIVGDPALLHADAPATDVLLAVREGLEVVLLADVSPEADVRLTCGGEDGDVVVRLVAREGSDESLWEWVI